jgi:hypothetical protein
MHPVQALPSGGVIRALQLDINICYPPPPPQSHLLTNK